MLSNSYEDLAYISSNDTLDYKPALINISDLTKERIEFFNTIAKVNGKKLIANIEEDLEYFINKIEFERIIDNNISNAIKYSTGEDIFINLFKRDGNIYLEVVSYGAPIKNKKEIFEINYREQLHKRGLGIGLNIVKTICEKYGIKYRTYYRNRQNVFEYIFPIRK
jgi:signal transduction histidine kinase